MVVEILERLVVHEAVVLRLADVGLAGGRQPYGAHSAKRGERAALVCEVRDFEAQAAPGLFHRSVDAVLRYREVAISTALCE